MRLSASVRRPFAVTAAAALLLTGSVASGLLVPPASAATVSITDINDPVNLASGTMGGGKITVTGTGMPGDSVSISATDGTRTIDSFMATPPTTFPVSPATPPATGGVYSASLIVPAGGLNDGTITVTITSRTPNPPSGSLDSVFRRVVLDLTPPGTPTALSFAPASLNTANASSPVTLTATAGVDTNSLSYSLAGPTGSPQTCVPAGPYVAGSVYSCTVSATNLPDGTLTFTATAMDTRFNSISATKTGVKDATAPNAPTYSAFTGTVNAMPASPDYTKINNSSSSVGFTLTSATDTATFAGTVSDGSTTFALTVGTPSNGVASASFNPKANGLADGTLTLSVVATDTRGNTSAAGTQMLTKDTTVPEVQGLVFTPAIVNSASAGSQKISGFAAKSPGSLMPSEPGTMVTLTVTCTGATITPTTVPILADGTFSATFNVAGCSDAGGVSVSAVARDGFSNSSPAATATATKDTVAPTVGPVTATNITSAALSSRVQATTQANLPVKVTLTDKNNATATNTGTADAMGAVDVSVNGSALADGTITASVVATDAAGNPSTPGTKTLIKDTVQFAFVSATPTGPTAPNSKVTGTFNEVLDIAGSSVTLRNSLNAVIPGNNSYSPDGKTIIFTPTGNNLPDGAYSATIVGKDSGPDNDPAVTKVQSFTVDSTRPAAPSLTSITNPVNAANAATVRVKGTAEAGSSVTITITDTTSGTPLTATATGPADATTGAFDIVLNTTPLKDGALSATGSATDAAGNVSSVSPAIASTKDTVAPTVTGVTATDTTQAAPKTTVAGSAGESGNTIAITLTDSAGTKVTGTGTSGTNGAFSIQVDASTLLDGTITASVIATDPAGNASTPATKTFVKDATGPAVTGLTATNVNIAAGGMTTIAGSIGEPGTAVVSVSDGTTSVMTTVTATANGAFSTTLSVSTLKEGTLTVTVTGKDAKANSGTPASKTITKDTVKPVVTGLAGTSTSTAQQKTTITGTTEGGASVALTATDGTKNVTGTATAAGNGSFSGQLDLTGFATGSIAISATATDTAGNLGDKANATATRDATAPVVSALTATTSTKASPMITVTGKVDDKTATVTLRATDSGSGAKTGTATVAADGTFSGTLDLSSLADGPVTVTATATDPAGNAGTGSVATTKDGTAPTVTELAGTSVSTAKPSTTVTGKVNDALANVALTATDSANATVTGPATVNRSTGAFTGSLDLSALGNGTITLKAVATDAVGNVGPAATTTITKDTVSPVISGLAATATSPSSPSTTVTGNVDDKAATAALSAVDSAGKSVSGTATVNASTGALSGTVDLSTLASGTITVFATATDAAGNVGRAMTTTTNTVTSPTPTPTATATPTATPTPAGPTAGGYTALAPARLLDTRTGVGAPQAPVAANGSVVLQVTGRGGVPATNVLAVVLNVTVASPTGTGFVTVYPSDSNRPTASNLNFVKGKTVPNAVVVPVSTDGKVTLFNGSNGTTQLLADVAGYYLDGVAFENGAFLAADPSRLLDTRTGVGAPRAAIAPGGVVRFAVADPTDEIGAVALNITVTAPTAGGFITAYAGGTSRPTVSNLNFVKGQTIPNLVVVPVAADGTVSLYNGSAGTVQLIADVFGGYFDGVATASGTFSPVTPSRLLDTRSGTGAPQGAVASNGSVSLQVLGRGGVPATGVAAVILNVTVTGPKAPGFITAYASGTTRPTASNLNFVAGQTVPNLVVVPVGADGKVTLFNGSTGSTQLLADVAGYVLK